MWQITSAWDLITAVSTAIIAIGVFVAFWELKEVRKARRIEAFNAFLEIWGSVEEREARRFVFREEFKFTGLPNLTDDQHKKIEMVLASCNRISYLTLNKLAPEEDVLRLIGRSIIHVWDCAKPFIDARREEAGEKPDSKDPYKYMIHLGEFAERYRTKLQPKPNKKTLS